MSNRTPRSDSVRRRRVDRLVILSVLFLLAGAPGGITASPAALVTDAPAVAASAAEGSALLLRVRAAWKGYQSLSATLEQTQQFAGFDEPLISRGSLKILRPRYFDLRFDAPTRQRQICDGTWVWTYMEEQKQVFKAPLGRDATRGADLLDWATEGAVAKSASPDSSIAPGAVRIELEPGPNLPLRELRLWVRPETAQILCYETVDTDGNRTRMRIIDLRRAKNLKPEQFRFTPPPGTEVIEMGQEP
jgi:outer membrane lipoprotein carrier protein